MDKCFTLDNSRGHGNVVLRDPSAAGAPIAVTVLGPGEKVGPARSRISGRAVDKPADKAAALVSAAAAINELTAAEALPAEPPAAEAPATGLAGLVALLNDTLSELDGDCAALAAYKERLGELGEAAACEGLRYDIMDFIEAINNRAARFASSQSKAVQS